MTKNFCENGFELMWTWNRLMLGWFKTILQFGCLPKVKISLVSWMFSSFSMDDSEDVGEANGDLLITKMFLRIAPFLGTVRTAIFLSSSSPGFFLFVVCHFSWGLRKIPLSWVSWGRKQNPGCRERDREGFYMVILRWWRERFWIFILKKVTVRLFGATYCNAYLFACLAISIKNSVVWECGYLLKVFLFKNIWK